jgi:alanyl-tRNA synthetase
MTSKEIRSSFLAYFEKQGHRIVPSSPLVPHEDPTLLFTNAGMNQFKDVLLGKEKRSYNRATTVQKCMRVSGKHNDLENVGPSFRHHTFFEMLGNFSFGDYFKREAIPFAWTLLTDVWQIPKDRLTVTIFQGDASAPRDAEAYDTWKTLLPAERIVELGAADNFWEMGDTGPCGRSSEIYFFRGASVACGEELAGRSCRGVECSCDRYVEIWNNVFMEFDRQADGTLNPLPAPSIDTGMGLERVAAVLQGHLSNYDTDLFTPILSAIGERAGTTHRGTMEPSDVSMRVIADHLRAMTFLIADGVVPSNEWRGYVLRKIMRRAMRHGKRLGIQEPFLHTMVDTMVREFGDAYPELKTGRGLVVQVIRAEEERFDAVLSSGLPRLEEILDKAASANGVVPGEAAFKLYDTHGLPRDFIEDMVEDRKLRLDQEGFERAMEAQREKARAKNAFKGVEVHQDAVVVSDEIRAELEEMGDGASRGDDFRGYETTEVNTRIVAVLDSERREVTSLSSGQDGFIVLAETPFYREAGGQVSDVGVISGPHGEAIVNSVIRIGSWPRLHGVRVTDGQLSRKDIVAAEVNYGLRDATRRNHTATHLLHAALRQVLGQHVKQAGSLVAPDRLRFDFVHVSPVTREQQLEIERIVNEQILRNTVVQTDVKNTQEAIAAGAMALFGEKYGDRVRVVSIPGFSVELCGGTHVRATGDIGFFIIESESGVAAGTRRITALTGMDAVSYFQDLRSGFAQMVAKLNVHPDRAADTIDKLQDENKQLRRGVQELKIKLASGTTTFTGHSPTVQISGPVVVPEEGEDLGGGVKLVRLPVAELDRDSLRTLVDRFRDKIKSGVVVLASPSDGKVSIVVGVTPDLTKKAPAGQIVKQLAPIVGGGGGGRPDFAEAGGKDPSKIGELLAASKDVIEKMLSA